MTSQYAFFRSALSMFCVVAAITALSVPAHAETTLQRAREVGYIRIGFANEAPFAYSTTDGKLIGEAPEVARAVLKQMGIPEIDGVLTEFGSLIAGVKAGRFDIIAAGMFIKPKRCKEVAFSEPSYGIGQAMLVPKGNPKRVKDYSSFVQNKELKLALMSGAVEVGFAKDAGIPDNQQLLLPDQSSALAAVQSGRADATASTAVAISVMAEKGEGVEMTPPFGEVAGKSVMGQGAFAFRKEDTDLIEEFNKHLKAFVGTPEHIALVTPYGFGKGYLPNKTAEQLCKGE